MEIFIQIMEFIISNPLHLNNEVYYLNLRVLHLKNKVFT